uniref:Laminin N-terminal domain-containing protein n=1 Tax=Trichuris muris TaxID=70415 RepID=A0A5S6QUR8_TRIMR
MVHTAAERACSSNDICEKETCTMCEMSKQLGYNATTDRAKGRISAAPKSPTCRKGDLEDSSGREVVFPNCSHGIIGQTRISDPTARTSIDGNWRPLEFDNGKLLYAIVRL